MKASKIIIITLIISLLTINPLTTIAFPNGNQVNSNTLLETNGSYENITVEEAYLLLNSTENGIQIPVDVRTDVEYASEHINTPQPENPKHHCVCEWDNVSIVQAFIELYEGNTIILYCRSGMRSQNAAEILVDYGFNGVIYNMLGGIVAWKSAGYPTKQNLPPLAPVIEGKIKGSIDESYMYKIRSIDPENHDIFIYINFSDNSETVYEGPFHSNETAFFNHTFNKKGTYVIRVKAWDIYGAESEWTELEVTMPKTRFKISEYFCNFIDYYFPQLFDFLFERLINK